MTDISDIPKTMDKVELAAMRRILKKAAVDLRKVFGELPNNHFEQKYPKGFWKEHEELFSYFEDLQYALERRHSRASAILCDRNSPR